MRILYDGAIYQEPAGGINRYFVNLIGRLPDSYTPLLTTCAGRDRQYPSHERLRIFRFTRFRPRRISVRMEKSYFGHVADSTDFDLAHPTYYSLLSQREISQYKRPVVLTVWDMIHELFPQLEPTGHVVEQKRKAIKAASAIICISENTKKDLLERYDVPEDKVTVTHLASQLNTRGPVSSQPVPSRPYFLYVGSRTSYKNFAVLLIAFARVADTDSESILGVAGPPLTSEERKRIAELGLTSRVEHYGFVDDSHLAKLYRHSLAFVYPSLYEGFGLPVLEALTCGTVVVASDRASIPEVLGDAGLLFNPEDPDELTDILWDLLRNPASREPLIAKGQKRAELFTWEDTAARTFNVYRSLVD